MIRKSLACSIAAAALSLGIAHAATTKPTINAGGSSLAFPTYTGQFALYTKALFSYEAVGSGAGQKAFINNDITYFEPGGAGTSNPNGYATGTLTYGTIVGTAVDIGASDAFLTASQLTNPATGSYTGTNGSSSVDGPLIQIPTFGTPITIAFDESGVGSGGLKLTDSQLCGVMSGKITDWNTLVPSIPAGTTINVAYRSDSSGTSFLLTQHLAAVCNSSNSAITFTATKTFASLFPSSTPPANFTGESGSSNVAKYLLGTLPPPAVAATDTLGYLSPDYTSIAPMSANTTSLAVASLVNGYNNVAYLPDTTNTALGLANPGSGSYNAVPPNTMFAAQNPLNWVPAIPVTNAGYPIVGYTTIDLSSCYALSAGKNVVGKDILGLVKDMYKSASYTAITSQGGFVPLINSHAAPFEKAVANVFLSNKAGYGLDINDATTCAAYAGR